MEDRHSNIPEDLLKAFGDLGIVAIDLESYEFRRAAVRFTVTSAFQDLIDLSVGLIGAVGVASYMDADDRDRMERELGLDLNLLRTAALGIARQVENVFMATCPGAEGEEETEEANKALEEMRQRRKMFGTDTAHLAEPRS